MFYGLGKGTSQVYVSRQRVRLSFGVEPPISPRPLYLCATKVSSDKRLSSRQAFSSSDVAAARPCRIIMREMVTLKATMNSSERTGSQAIQ